MYSKQIMAFSQAISGLSSKIELLNSAGRVIAPKERIGYIYEEVAYIPQNDISMLSGNGNYFHVISKKPRLYLVMPKGLSNVDICTLIGNFIENAVQPGRKITTKKDVFRYCLNKELARDDAEILMAEYRIDNAERCVIVLKERTGISEGLINAMEELFSDDGQDDIFIQIDRNSAAIIKQTDGDTEYEDLIELCMAIHDTAQQEGDNNILFGIGELCSSFLELAQSYEQALSSIRLGELFEGDSCIYVHSRQFLERLLTEIAPAIGDKYVKEVFGKRKRRFFNEEIMQTVSMFMECDLNMSETARKLYVHRNTLVYRLDQFKQETGFDLRRFKDAVAFCVVIMLGKLYNET